MGASRNSGIKSIAILFTVIVDKKALKEKYQTPQHPYHYGLETLIERYVAWLEAKQSIGDVIAETRGGTKDRPLEQQ